MTPPSANSLDEFDVIARFFAPLSRGAAGAFNLTDDVAQAPYTSSGVLLSCDSVVEGVHFLPGDSLDSVARKLLRRNLSDIFAKGAKPLGYLLALMWPRSRPVEHIGEFAAGLAEDQEIFGLSLWGGDTTSTDGPLTATITIVGEALGRGPVRRAGCAIGDAVFLTGTIGDGGLGLLAAKNMLRGLSDEDLAWLEGRYRLPQPRSAVSRIVSERGTASIDVSDGFVADTLHLARASGMRLEIQSALLPLSEPAERWLKAQSDQNAGLAQLLSGGDDYEVLFCVAEPVAREVLDQAKHMNLQLTRIGTVAKGNGVGIKAHDGRPLVLTSKGWRHF